MPVTTGGKVLVLDAGAVASLIDMAGAIDAVEEAFRVAGNGLTRNYPVVRESIEEASGTFGIKSGFMPQQGWLGLKAGGYWSGNMASRGISNHQSTVVLFDYESGQPRCFMNANRLTALRTGAAGAVAAKYLARPDSRAVLFVGAGEQARSQLEALRCIFDLSQIHIWSRDPASAQQFAHELTASGLHANVVSDPADASDRVDLIVTTTPSTQALLAPAHMHRGLHVNAMGSDTRGKRELAPEIFGRDVRLVVDNRDQSTRLGELQNVADADRMIHATLGEIVAGKAPGRRSENDITVFDSSGVTFQDLAVAGRVYEKALELGTGSTVAF